MFVIFSVFLVAVLTINLFKLPHVKGIVGEWQVRIAAYLQLDRKTYHVYNNVTLQTPDDTTQIDHIIVSRFGIFVIETKNIKGWIFGSPQQASWTQQIYQHKTRFQNPLRQNYKHTKAVEALLELSVETVHSVIVFASNANFKTPMPENVLHLPQLSTYIRSKQTPILNPSQVSAVKRAIETGRLAANLQTHKAHVASVQKRIQTQNDPNAAQSCPRCGEPLVLRTVKRGEHQGRKFWGCSQYPSCRYTRALPPSNG
jgi:hypothetical protein